MSTTSASTAPAPDRLAEADFYRFLAACYYEPEAAFAEERLFDSLAATAARLDPGLAESARRLGEAFSSEKLEDLAVDHARLFIGPSPAYATPYGETWTDGTDVAALYAGNGLEVDDLLHERPDHIAIELEFLYFLLRQGKPDAIVREHLRRWVPPFARAVQAGAQTRFYRELAALTAQAL